MILVQKIFFHFFEGVDNVLEIITILKKTPMELVKQLILDRFDVDISLNFEDLGQLMHDLDEALKEYNTHRNGFKIDGFVEYEICICTFLFFTKYEKRTQIIQHVIMDESSPLTKYGFPTWEKAAAQMERAREVLLDKFKDLPMYKNQSCEQKENK